MMRNFFKNNFFAIFLALAIISSFSFLSFLEKNQADLNKEKDWWIIYFENPKNNSMDFTIENHSNSENFHWEVYLEKNRVHENDALVPKGENRSFQVSSEGVFGKKISIKVTNKTETREIYKIIQSE